MVATIILPFELVVVLVVFDVEVVVVVGATAFFTHFPDLRS